MCTRDDSAVVKEKKWNGEVIIVLCCIEMLFLQITYGQDGERKSACTG